MHAWRPLRSGSGSGVMIFPDDQYNPLAQTSRESEFVVAIGPFEGQIANDERSLFDFVQDLFGDSFFRLGPINPISRQSSANPLAGLLDSRLNGPLEDRIKFSAEAHGDKDNIPDWSSRRLGGLGFIKLP